MCSTMAGPRRGSGRAANIIPSCRSPCRSRRCPGRGCSASRPQQLLAAVEAVTVQNEHIVGAHHLHRRGRRGGVRAARLADPPRHPISLVQPRLCELRRLPRAADEPQAQGHAQGARRRARGSRIQGASRRRDRPGRVGRDVGLLPGHRLAEVGPALSDARSSSTWSASAWATSCCCSSPTAAASRSPARSISSAPDTLYGRYWGCTEEVPFLHFELCYYQAIEWAIAHGLACVQAGAQGEHKLARGYEPVITRSAPLHSQPRLPGRGRRISRSRARGRLRRGRMAPPRPALPLIVLVGIDSRPSGRSRRPCRDTWRGW